MKIKLNTMMLRHFRYSSQCFKIIFALLAVPVSLFHGRNCFCQGQELEFDMKYHILYVFITSTAFKEKSSDHFKDISKKKFLKLRTNFDVDMTSFLGRDPNCVKPLIYNSS